MSELIQKAINTVESAYLQKGNISTEDVPPELLAYLREGLKDSNAEFVGDGNFPSPLPDFFKAWRVEGNRLLGGDFIDITLPESDEDVGDIPEIEYSESNMLDAGPLSTRRKQRLEEELAKIFQRDRTTGVPQEMNIPERVEQDPLGADFTGQMRPVADE